MSSEPGGFLVPEGLADGLIDSVRTAMEVQSWPRCVPMTAEIITEASRARKARFREHQRFMASPEGKAVVAARKAEHEAKREAERAAAVTEWEEVRRRYADSPAILAVLDIHQVGGYFGEVACAHPISGWEAESEEWPCSTFEAIRDAVPSGSERA